VPDTTPRRGSADGARAVLRNRAFRAIFIGATVSNIGTWMQNFTLPAYVDERTGSAGLVGLLVFAQLGPLLLLSVPAGVVADRVNRTRLVVAMQCTMLALSLVLAGLVRAEATLLWVFIVQLGIGIANTVQAPAFSSSLPMLVTPEQLPAAVSLNSAMINGSRIMGPALAAMAAVLGAELWQLFALNAATYLVFIMALRSVGLPAPPTRRSTGPRALTDGIRLAAQRAILGRILATMFSFSLLCLPFIGLFPSVARLNFGLEPDGTAYRLLYVVWGIGAFVGSLAVGSILHGRERRDLIRIGFAVFALCLAIFGLTSSPIIAFAIAGVLGASYFMTATLLVTELQVNLADTERASVMPLWFMVFGGTVPLGNVIAGPIMDHLGARPVLVFGALAAVAIGYVGDIARSERLGQVVTTPTTGPSRQI